MKKNYKQCKTRFLLFFLLSLFAGGLSPAWAQVTESFEDITLVDADSWGRSGKFSNGWVCVGSTGTINNAGLHASSEDYPFYLYSSGNTGDKALGGIASSSNNYYLVIPTLISGDVTYYCKGTASTYGYLRFYKVTDNGDDTYTIGSQIGSVVSKNSSSGWVSGNVSIGEEETMIAIKLNRMAIDDITYTPYVESGVKKPKSLTITSITSESADFSWSKGDEADAAWQIVYSTDENFDKDAASPIDVNTTSYSFSGLEPNTTYYAAVRTYAGSGDGEQSAWVSTSFKTEKVATPATGFTDNFETDKGWELINGTLTNKWVCGTATNNGGSNALYISNDGGTTNAYSSSSATMAYTSKLFHFEAGDYTISYDWKANGESGWDFMRVVLVPANVELAAGTTLPSGLTKNTVPSGWQALDGGSELSLSDSWATKPVDISIAEAGNYQVVFAWRNDGSGGTNPPAAIDNFKILGAAPVLELGGDVAGTTLAFGSVAETTNKTITITNVGKVAMENITLTETADEDNVFAYASLPKTSLDADESMDVQVTFSGSSAKDYTGTFRVAADDCDPIDVTVTATFSNSPAAMALTLDEVAVGASVSFGEVGKQMVKTFTVTNDGDQTLNVAIASNNTTDFTVAPAALNVTGHTSEIFTVTFVYDAEALDAEKTATITVTPSNDGLDPVEFTVTGTRIEQWSEDFSAGTLPDGWEITNGTYWKVQDNMLKGSYSYGNFDLITPSLIVEAGQTMTFDYRMTSTYRSLDIQYSKNNGAWTNLATISYSGLTQNQWYTYTIEGLDEGSYKFRFGDSNYDLDNFQGFKRNLNDPKMGIYSDEECTVSVATNVTTDLGFATTDQTATYYIKNDGTGTMTLSKGDNPAGFTATLDKTSVAAGEHATLTITMPAADNAGYHSGNIVVTATDLGTFTVAAQGVVVDENKLYLDFSSDNIPSTWSNTNFTKNSTDISCGYSTGTLQTVSLTAEANEKVVVRAKQDYTTSSYTFGVNYRKVGDEEWSELIAPANIGTSYVTLAGTITEAGNYELQFTGRYVHISHIYGLIEAQEPVMVVYDNEAVAGSIYNFGNVSDEADATWTLTVKNEGKATLTGLAAALSGTNAAHYSVEVSATELAVDASTTITVKQLKNDLGAHSATLTISADNLESKEIALSGYTYDHNKMFVDFEGGSFPAGWTTNSWTVATTSGNQHARAGFTASSLITTPLTVGEDESLVFKAKRQYSNSAPYLQIRYTTNGGVTWTDYADYASQVTSGDFTNITLSGISAGTAIVEIYGRYVDIDDIIGFTPTTAPVLSLTESAVAVASGSTKEFGNLTEAGTAIYTLSNTGTANLVSTVATTGVATAAISGEGEGVTISENTVTLEPGKSATITLTLPFVAPYGDKAGAMTITTEGWVGDFTVNYTASTVDPTALYIDFSSNAKPEGWYQDGWSFTSGYASAAYVANKQMITQKLSCAGTDDVLSFDVWPYTSSYGSYTNALTVEYSADRKNWTAFANQPTFENTERQNGFQVSGAPAGDYYVRFTGSYVYLDNISGWHKVTGIDHDLYVSATSFPTNTLLPETSNGVVATATVYSLRADETGVYAKLFFGETEMATSTTKDIAKDDYESFTMTCNVPAEEGTYAAKIVVYYSDESVAWETATTDVVVAHTRTLEITAFARDGEGTMDANAQNQISPVFNITVQNNGTTNYTSPTVKVFNGEVEVGSATSDATVAPNGTTQLTVTATNMSAGEGGELSFTAKAYWDAAEFSYDTPVVITVNAAAPKFNMAVKGGEAVEDGDAVAFGLVKAATTKTFTITNSGTAALELVSIVAPSGYSATAVTDANKTIAVDGTLDIDVTLAAEQGKVNGNLVITYKVDATTNNTFTLALSGRSIAADTWTEDFESGIPANWTNENGWSIGITDGNRYATRTGWEPYSIMTPRLQAAKDEVLTFDVLFVGSTFSYAYSTDKVNWSEEVVIDATGEQTFTAPADGNYYLKFITRNGRLDNLIGFHLNPLDLILDETADNDFDTANYDNVTLNRAFIAGWNTVCLPFAIDNITAFFGDGAYAYTFTGYNEGDLTFTIVEDAMTAATPYLVFVPAAITSKELKNISISGEDAGSVGDENATFTGTYDRIAAGNLAGKYVLTPAATIQKAGDGAWMNAFRAYFTIPSGNVKALVFDGGTATGVRRFELTGNEDVRDIFDLAGRKLNETRKGINIVNGKKVLVK